MKGQRTSPEALDAPPRNAAPSTLAILASTLRAQAAVQRASAEALERAADALETEPSTTSSGGLVAIDDAPVERATLLRLAREGRLHVVQLGRRKFVRAADLVALVAPSSPAKTSPSRPYTLADALERRST